MTEYKTINQVARELGYHRRTVETWLLSGKLRGVKVNNGRWRISSDALDEFLRKGAQKQ